MPTDLAHATATCIRDGFLDYHARFAAITGSAHALTRAADQAAYLTEWRDRWTGKAALVLRPADVEQVAAIVRLASETRTALVPQGGNTGLVGGQIPDDSGDQIVVPSPASAYSRRTRSNTRPASRSGASLKMAVSAVPEYSTYMSMSPDRTARSQMNVPPRFRRRSTGTPARDSIT